MIKLSFVVPYYMNPRMLKMQFEIMNEYYDPIKANFQFIVVDDASPIGYRAEEAIEKWDLKPKGFDFQLYRILTDLRWNQDAAKNIGAHYASGHWLLLTDIDHLIYPKEIEKLMLGKYDEGMFYTFNRLLYPKMEYKKPHPNSYLMTKEFYWKAGGYDEIYCGHYGTDGIFRRTLELYGKTRELKIPLVLVGRSDLPDASTTTLKRKEEEDKNLIYQIRHIKNKNKTPIQTFKLPYKRII